ncbi:expressed unknown protein [Ectocarpus siliculosus]|uniref:Tudor domain-containing protein n=1 Tax=Ectocarpus siliculosus TaxID=2880 RepID=D8LG94_ECTSI|nr:expressed unknown protein [Ectocarpus siliculosus]|eukprot:CBN78993.1 expressed unknown protein [Ectocarpus siliculosus]
MLNAVLVFCAVVLLFVYLLVKNYDDDSVISSSTAEEGRKTKDWSKRRKRKGKAAAAKKSKALPAAAGDAAPGRAGEDGSSQNRRAKHQLDAQEWPTLGETPQHEAQEEEEEEEEDLAALHAEMLKAARSHAGGSSSSDNKGMAGKAMAAGDGRESARRNSGRIGVGDRVEGRFEAGAEWFPAVVTKLLHGGFVNLLYDDGERETRVPLALVRHRGATAAMTMDSDSGDSSDEGAEAPRLPTAKQRSKQADGWEVMVQKPKKTRVERVESRIEANSNLKNRLKRQKKREKELAAREALRKKL